MTFQVAAEEARHLRGEVIPLDLAAHGKGRIGITRRFPIGPVAAISPFNFPLNLSAHKLAPAIAAGNPIVLKPATKTPLSALMLGDMMSRAGLPPGAVSVLPMARATGDRLVTDERFKLLTFTGSSAVGWDMKGRAGARKSSSSLVETRQSSSTTAPIWSSRQSAWRPAASPLPARAA